MFTLRADSDPAQPPRQAGRRTGGANAEAQRGKDATNEDRGWRIEDGRTRLRVCFSAHTSNLAQRARFSGSVAESRRGSQRVIFLCVQIGLALVASLPLGVFALTALFQVKSLLDKSSEVCILTSDTWGPLGGCAAPSGGGPWMSGPGGRPVGRASLGRLAWGQGERENCEASDIGQTGLKHGSNMLQTWVTHGSNMGQTCLKHG